jgi:hypothetical protein
MLSITLSQTIVDDVTAAAQSITIKTGIGFQRVGEQPIGFGMPPALQ